MDIAYSGEKCDDSCDTIPHDHIFISKQPLSMEDCITLSVTKAYAMQLPCITLQKIKCILEHNIYLKQLLIGNVGLMDDECFEYLSNNRTLHTLVLDYDVQEYQANYFKKSIIPKLVLIGVKDDRIERKSNENYINYVESVRDLNTLYLLPDLSDIVMNYFIYYFPNSENA